MVKTFASFLIQKIGKPMPQLDDHLSNIVLQRSFAIHTSSHRIVYTPIPEAIEWNIVHRGKSGYKMQV